MAPLPERARHNLEPVLARLNAFRPLRRSEVELIESLGVRSRIVPAGTLLLEDGERVRKASYVVSGWAYRQSTLPDGRRQIVSFILPGEAMGLHQRPRPLALTTTVALTSMITVDARPLLSKHGDVACGLKDVLEFATAMDEQRLVNHVVRLGRQTAYERFCSLLIELAERLELIGSGDHNRFALPVTQEVFADTLGLSTVHVNRTLQQMRRDGLVDLHAGILRILDRPAMERFAGRA